MALTEAQRSRYARHLILREVGARGQEKLLSSSALVIGAGGLGSAALLYLAAAGIGTLGIADGDTVDLSNLGRQILHTTDRVGAEKTASAAEALRARNPDVALRLFPRRVTAENILALIAPYDVVLDCTDRFETKFLINDACVLAGKPFVHAGAVRFEGQVLTVRPGRGPCLRCLLGEIPPPWESATCAQVGVLGAVTGVLGSMQALEAVKVLLGIGETLTGRVLTYDGLSAESRAARFPRDPDCPLCGAHPQIRALDPAAYAGGCAP